MVSHRRRCSDFDLRSTVLLLYLWGTSRPSRERSERGGAHAMIEATVDITTADGSMETFICRPERGGPYPLCAF